MSAFNGSSELEQLRSVILQARRDRATNEPVPANLRRVVARHGRAREQGWNVSDVVVTRDGEIRTKDQVGNDRAVSRVSTEIFA